MNSLGSFTISMEDSQDFACASGDYNPLHLDPVAARRTRFGHTLIHGVCGTLKALDLLLAQRQTNAALLSLRVKYIKPASQGQNLSVSCESFGNTTRIEVFAEGTRCQIIDLELGESPKASHAKSNLLVPCSNSAGACVDLNVEACEGLSGAVDLIWNQGVMDALFPSATRSLPSIQLAVLLASTQIVGMQCPGLHSVFAQLNLRFSNPEPEFDPNADARLQYKVLTVDPRIDRVELSLKNEYTDGTIEAFFRPPPVHQASFAEIATRVSGAEFSNQLALVIGASRGLGEIISKVLAAGGARVVMTYAAGREDAIRVSREIGQFRGTPDIFAYDVLEGRLQTGFIEYCKSVTHIYYLASPTIIKSDGGQWDPQLFARYCNFYINGLAMLLQQVTQYRPDNRSLKLFIPSSIFLQNKIKGFDEYVAAKAAAEVFVQSYEKSHSYCSAVAPRLPRLHTDQTAGIKNISEQETLEIIIEQLRLAFGNSDNTPVSAL